MRSVRGITFEARPPRALIRILCLVVVVGAIAPLFTALPRYARWLLAIALAAHGAVRIARLVARSPAVAEWAADGVWVVIDRHGEAFAAELDGFRVVGTWVLLRLRWENGRSPVFLYRGNADPDDLRVLRVRLGGVSGVTLP